MQFTQLSLATTILLDQYPLFHMRSAELDHLSGYKFVEQPHFATGMLNGTFKIGTLNEYRAIEKAQQGDKDEAVQTYLANYKGSSETLEAKYVMSNAAIWIENCDDVTIQNCSSTQSIEDAFVFCLSEKFRPEVFKDQFGEHCVKVSNIEMLFDLMTQRLMETYHINRRAMGRVIYRERGFTGMEPPPGPLGFVKPRDEYANQTEIRFIWTVREGDSISPTIINIPYASFLCSLMGQ